MVCSKFATGLMSCALILLSSSVHAQSLKAPAAIETAGQLDILSSPDYQPFRFTDANGNRAGIDVELRQAIVDLYKVKPNVIVVPFSNLMPSLQSGRGKVIWAPLNVTEERAKQVDFVTYGQNGVLAAATADKASGIGMKSDGTAELCGHNVGVSLASSGEIQAQKADAECQAAGKPAVTISRFPSVTDQYQALLSGRTDLTLGDSTALGYFIGTTSGKLVLVGQPTAIEPYALSVAKGDTATATMLRDGLQALIDSGKYGETMARYGLQAAAIKQSRIITKLEDLKN